MGLPGPGAERAINQILNSKLLSYNKPLGLSIGGESPEGYLETFNTYNKHIAESRYPFYYEINISCPNTEKGKHLTSNVELLEKLVKSIRGKTNRVISVKVSPDQSDQQLQAIAEMLSAIDCIAVNSGNTQYRSTSDVGLEKNAISYGGGGLSGAPLFKRTCEMIKLLKPFKLPIIATGGISSKHHVQLCLENGASLVGMATALALDPFCIPKIINEL